MAGVAGSSLLRFIYNVLNIAIWVIFIDAIMSWIWRDPAQMPRAITSAVLTPVYTPIRELISGFYAGPIDLSPIVVLLVLFGIRAAIRPKLGAPP